MPTAVITGSTRGIGLGLARELARRGCQVVISGRDEDTVAQTAAALGTRAFGVACDVSDPDAVQALWDGAKAHFGAVDIWVNNAGATTSPKPFWQLPVEQIEQVVRTNLLGTAYGTHVALAGMGAQPSGGHIFNVEGMGSRKGKREVQAGVITYGTTKAGVGYLDASLAKELRAGGRVMVSTIRPGINVTDHLLHDVDTLPATQWAASKRTLNILGDLPETTTPWIAERILAATKPTHIAWLSGPKIAWRFATAGLHKRDLFAGVDPSRLPAA